MPNRATNHRSDSISAARSYAAKSHLAKESVTRPVLDSIPVLCPGSFKAILMPNTKGIEVDILEGKGVPRKNIFAVEREKDIHAAIVAKGLSTSPRPMDVVEAIDHAWGALGWANLVYLDFFGQPNAAHWDALRKIFALRMIPEGGTLLLTFGYGRGEPFACKLNRMVTDISPAQAYVYSAVQETGHRECKISRDHPYISGKINFILSEFRF